MRHMSRRVRNIWEGKGGARTGRWEDGPSRCYYCERWEEGPSRCYYCERWEEGPSRGYYWEMGRGSQQGLLLGEMGRGSQQGLLLWTPTSIRARYEACCTSRGMDGDYSAVGLLASLLTLLPGTDPLLTDAPPDRMMVQTGSILCAPRTPTMRHGRARLTERSNRDLSRT